MMVTMLPRAAMHVVYQFFVVLLVQHLHSDNNLSPFLFSTTTSLFAISAPLSNPILNDTTVHLAVPEYFDNKRHFRKFEKSVPEVLHGVPIITLKHKHPQCSISFKQRWSTSVGSSVYSTPVIFPSGQEGKKQIFLNTFYEFLEIIGQDGYKPWGWPLAFEGASFQGSPLLYDIDGDGFNDLGAADKNGNLYWVRIGTFGQYLDDYHVRVPKLKIKREWYKNIDPEYIDNFVMTSMFHHDERSEDRSKKARVDGLSVVNQASYPETGSSSTPKKEWSEHFHERRLEADHVLDNFEEEFKRGFEMGKEAGERHHAEKNSGDPEKDSSNPEGFEPIQDDDVHRFHGDFHHLDVPSGLNGTTETEWIDHGEHDYPGMMDDYNAWRGREEYYYHYGRRHRIHAAYMDDYFGGTGGEYLDSDEFVYVDAHILGNPTLADANGDGHRDVIMAVSYYFDKTEYASRGDIDFDTTMYVAGGIVVWDLANQNWAWTVHLDLTTDHTKFKALIHGDPVVADLNGDLRNEVIIGTSLGLLYVLDGETGFARRFFPMQFHSIQATVAVADVKGGGDLEMIVADMGGNLVVVDLDGEVLWDKQLDGPLPHTPTVGDVDGDGELDIVVVSVTDSCSHVWAVRGSDGVPLDGYPIALPHASVASAPSLLVDLHMHESYHKGADSVGTMDPLLYSDENLPPWLHSTAGHLPAKAPSTEEEEKEKKAMRGHTSSSHGKKTNLGLHIIVPSHDGHVYVIDGKIKCAERIDTGEHIYSMPLADDVTGDGYMDVVIGTMNGEVLVLETLIPYHPMNAWSSFPKDRGNGFTHGATGISVPLFQKRLFEQVSQVKSGNVLSMTIDIWDLNHKDNEKQLYTVIVSRGTNTAEVLLTQDFTKPGRYVLQIPVVPPEAMNLVVGMINEHGQYFEDIVFVSVSTRFYVWIKYLIVAPVILFVTPLLLMRGSDK